MIAPIPFQQIGRIPAPGDNVAIAVRRIEAGVIILLPAGAVALPFTVLEGHRFAIGAIRPGEPLLSWELPFGVALREIRPGEYVCNSTILAALRDRHVDFPIPAEPNFKDHFELFQLDETSFRPGRQVEPVAQPGTFQGFDRGSRRGAGTRNFIAVIGTSSMTASLARLVADHFKRISERYPNIDGVVAVAHTEGGGPGRPNNLDFILRCLAGFMVHPNLAAVLAVDFGAEPVNNALLNRFINEKGYPLDAIPHRFMSVAGNLQQTFRDACAQVESWLESANACSRTAQPIRNLKLALQCGGSDAFSGVSGNPVAGLVAREIIRHGGSANLAETDELFGAEPYILRNVRDVETARAFLAQLRKFQERVGWHGLSAESNPSGGNQFRGLYNISLKSIGAALKKSPDTRLDYVIDYAERMTAPGFYFMDSPGNDLEGIAGQVASGCNMILFTTGNGSVTNFPFVPTIKVMTNSGRFELLSRDMDVNAGRYLEGVPMETIGQETFELALRIASGQRSVGEKAGHAQVQLWREWRQTDRSRLSRLQNAPKPSGQPLRVTSNGGPPKELKANYRAYPTESGFATDQIGLIVPTSLCSAQIGRMIAEKLNRTAQHSDVTRYVALPHTEGCGVSGDDAIRLLERTMAGYLRHPSVRRGLLLEHGCEKTHNDAMRNFLAEHGLSADRFGWASVQLDGGIDNVTRKVVSWFTANRGPALRNRVETSLQNLRLGLLTAGEVPEELADAFAELARIIVEAQGTIVAPQNATLWRAPKFRELLADASTIEPTLAYGDVLGKSGFHMMETPTEHFVETATGLAATGVDLMLAFVAGPPQQAHPMIPLLQISVPGNHKSSDDFDLVADLGRGDLFPQLLELTLRTASGAYVPKLFANGNIDFQVTRGWLGVST